MDAGFRGYADMVMDRETDKGGVMIPSGIEFGERYSDDSGWKWRVYVHSGTKKVVIEAIDRIDLDREEAQKVYDALGLALRATDAPKVGLPDDPQAK
jgi:hypothetical protein